MLGLDARAGIAHLAENVFAASKSTVLESKRLALAHIGGPDRNLAAVGHGIPRIHREIHNNLKNLAFIRLDEPKIASVLDRGLYLLAERAAHRGLKFLDNVGEFQNSGAQGLTARIGQDLLDEFGGARRAAFDVHHVLEGWIGGA